MILYPFEKYRGVQIYTGNQIGWVSYYVASVGDHYLKVSSEADADPEGRIKGMIDEVLDKSEL